MFKYDALQDSCQMIPVKDSSEMIMPYICFAKVLMIPKTTQLY